MRLSSDDDASVAGSGACGGVYWQKGCGGRREYEEGEGEMGMEWGNMKLSSEWVAAKVGAGRLVCVGIGIDEVVVVSLHPLTFSLLLRPNPSQPKHLVKSKQARLLLVVPGIQPSPALFFLF